MRDTAKLIITVTVCVSFFIWGTILLVRLVPAPPQRPLTSAERYTQCLSRATPTDDKSAVNATCKELSEQ